MSGSEEQKENLSLHCLYNAEGSAETTEVTAAVINQSRAIRAIANERKADEKVSLMASLKAASTLLSCEAFKDFLENSSSSIFYFEPGDHPLRPARAVSPNIPRLSFPKYNRHSRSRRVFACGFADREIMR